jgi:alpha-amylase
MRSICFYFQVHQPLRLRTYRFFDIGAFHNYYDDYQNRFIMRRIADKSYIPMNKLLMQLIKEYGSAFKVSFSISGVALDQIRMYAPDVLQSFQKLAATGNVEFLAETYSHSLSSLKSKTEFTEQVNKHRAMIREYFGQEPTTFRNTELIYSDGIGEMVAEMGFKTQLTEGAKHILGWKSPNFIYCNAINPKLKILLKNYQLSDDIAFRFSERGWSEWPLTAEKFVDWLNAVDPKQEVVNLFMDYETFGEHQWRETGIFDFMRALPARVFSHSDFTFNTPAELSEKLQPVSAIRVEDPISWADEERDLTAWLGNDLQDDAFDNLYALEDMVRNSEDPEIHKDWGFLQASDHFYYMCTKWFSDGDVHKYFNPYGSPYEAYINYMNVISDLRHRLENKVKPGEPDKPGTIVNPSKAATNTRKDKLAETSVKSKIKAKKAVKAAPKKSTSRPSKNT